MTNEPHEPPCKYFLVAQSPSDLLILGVRGQSICLCRTAAEVLASPELMAGLSPEDAAKIGIIQGMSLVSTKLPSPQDNPTKDCISSNSKVQ